jgi:aminopeptidase YwaD
MSESSRTTSKGVAQVSNENRPDTTSSLSRRGLLGAVAGGAVLSTLPALPSWAADDLRPGAVRAPSLDRYDLQVVRELSAEKALRHLQVLAEHIGPRIGGTAGERRAADYIADQLDRLYYDVTLQPFPVADKFLAQIGDPKNLLPDDLCWQAGSSPAGLNDVTVEGPAVDVGPITAPNWPADGVPGTIVLGDDTATARGGFVADAAARGAAAVVLLPADAVFPRRAQAFSPSAGLPTTGVPIPVVGVAQRQKQHLRETMMVTPLPLSITTVAHRGLTSHNVLAERRGHRDGVVMVSGHYDSVIGAPGANDDGSGTVLTMEIARVLRRLPTRSTLRFALWGSEEQGLIGSRYHVAQLAQPERDRIRAVFQNDMVATSWNPAITYWLLSFTGLANTATDAVRAAGQRLGYDAQMVGPVQRGASDHQSFQEVGIASANFSWRGEGGPFLLEPPYHSPEDTIAENVSLDRLQVSMELIGSAAYAVART